MVMLAFSPLAQPLAGGPVPIAAPPAPATPAAPAIATAPAIPTGPVIDVSGGRADPSPEPGHYTFEELLHGLNPLHYVPVVGMIYRAVTGETAPVPERIAISAVASLVLGGPLGVLGTLVGCLAEEMWKMGTSGSVPQTGAAAGTPASALAAGPDVMPGSG